MTTQTQITAEALKTMKPEDVAKLISQLAAERDAARAAATTAPGRLSLKIGEKGGLSVCGLQRFPVTLYAEQWERLLCPAQREVILAFIKANHAKLSRKA